MEFFQKLEDGLWVKIGGFLEIQSIIQLEMIMKNFRLEHERGFEEIWKRECVARWNLKSSTLEHKTDQYKQLYHSFLMKKQLPFGKFSSHQHWFGFGKNTEIAMWLMLNHSPDGLLRRHKTSDSYLGEIRLCIQNLSSSITSIDLSSKSLVTIMTPIIEDLKDSSIHCLTPKLLSKNGNNPVTNKESVLLLHQFEFIVIGIPIQCPETIENEPDLLSAIDSLDLQYRSKDSLSTLNISTITEDKIWSAYQALPRGIFILK